MHFFFCDGPWHALSSHLAKSAVSGHAQYTKQREPNEALVMLIQTVNNNQNLLQSVRADSAFAELHAQPEFRIYFGEPVVRRAQPKAEEKPKDGAESTSASEVESTPEFS